MNADQESKKQRARFFIVAYPFALIAICIVLNFLAFGIQPVAIALPSDGVVVALVVAAVLLLVNHTWLMTTTELTRVRYGMYATPEEWHASGKDRDDTAPEGVDELERRHNAHRNTTENTVYFVLAALVFSLVTPSVLAAYVWIIGFAVARIGYTHSYLSGKDGLRGLFMSLSLLSLYGISSYLVIGLLV